MKSQSIASKILSSSFWQYSGSWVSRLLGFASTIILARLLVPDDFGVVAAAIIVTGLFHVISSVGTEHYLLRKSELIDADLNTGWTINLIMKTLVALAIYFSAEFVALFMNDERLVSVLQVVCLSPFLQGFNNIGMIFFEKSYNYKPQFIIGLMALIVAFISKIILALILNNYWAFIYAELLSTLTYLIGTYAIQSYRPRLSLANWKLQWAFSQWILLKSIFVYMRFRVDNIIMSKYLPLESLGIYTVARELATMPSGQIVGPIMYPLYVALSSAHKDKKLIADQTHKILSVIFLLVLPISFGTYITAENLVWVVLGHQWGQAIPILMILCFVLLPSILSDLLTKVMTAMGKVKLIFFFETFLGFNTIAIFSFYIFFTLKPNIHDIALLRVIVITLNSSIVLLIITRLSEISLFRVLALMVMPLLSSIAMAVIVNEFSFFIKTSPEILQLIIQVLAGILCYLAIVTLFIFMLKDKMKEYEFIWKTFYLSVFNKLLHK